jgi:hypothetical protein
MADLLLAYHPDDAPLGREVAAAAAVAGFETAPWSGEGEPPPSRLVVFLVTRVWSRAGGLNEAIDKVAARGTRAVIAWWDEDAPSDFLTDRAAEDEIFYACFLPRSHRPPALAERLRDELRNDAPGD